MECKLMLAILLLTPCRASNAQYFISKIVNQSVYFLKTTRSLIENILKEYYYYNYYRFEAMLFELLATQCYQYKTCNNLM